MSVNSDATPVPVSGMLPHEQFMQHVLPISNWGQWLELAQAATTLDQKLGLLHCAFGVELGHREYDPGVNERPPYTPAERLEFFFGIADGWLDWELFDFRPREERFSRQGDLIEETSHFVGYDKDGHRREQRTSQLRQRLAIKAFDMLALNFFRMTEKGVYGDTVVPETKWLRKIVSGPLFPTIRKFFRVDKGRFGDVRIRNLSIRHEERSSNEKIAIDFLLRLPRFIWEWKEVRIESHWPEKQKLEEQAMNTLMRSRVDDAKPWLLEILLLLGETRLIRWDWKLGFNKACLKKLKQIAFRHELLCGTTHQVDKNRPVATLDEACYLGSPAAWLIRQHELMISERARLSGILEATRNLQEAERQVAKLKK